jgi:ribosomal protein S27E
VATGPGVDLDQWLRGARLQTVFMKGKRVIRHCPICRLAMVGSKSREDLAGPDVFRCLSCGTEIIEAQSEPRNDGGKKD